MEKLDLNYRDDGAAEKLMSLILRNKLPSDFMVELSRKLGHNYASVSEILDNCVSVHSLLNKGEVLASSEKSSIRPKEVRASLDKPQAFHKTSKEFISKVPKIINNKETGTGCKFCPSLDHSSTRCKLYPTHDSRIKRAASKGLRTRCLSKSHSSEKCISNHSNLAFSCISCKSHKHVTPMCPQMVLSLRSSKKISSVGDSI